MSKYYVQVPNVHINLLFRPLLIVTHLITNIHTSY